MVTHDINPVDNPDQCNPKDAQCLLRELRFHQAELARCRQESRELQRQMEEMRGSYAEFSDLLPVGYLTLDERGRMLGINQTGAAMLGGKPANFLDKQFIAWVAEDDIPLFLSRLQQAFLNRDNPVIELKIETANGALRDVRLECKVVENADAGKVPSCHILMSDLTEHKGVEAAATLTSSVIGGTVEGVMITDPHNIIRLVNPAFEKISGYSANEAVGCTPALLKSNHHDKNFYQEMWETLNKDGQWQGGIWNRHKNGGIYPVWLNISAIKDSRQRIIHYVGVISDSPIQELILERLQYLAYNDVLTGLPNRRLFLDRLNVSMSHARRDKHMLAVLFVDLDQFKQVNDTLGHKAGDELLVGVSERMKDCLREGDTLARLGGDEFAVVLPAIPNAGAASNVARKFMDCYAKPLNINGKELNVSASIGISVFPNDGEDVDDLLHHADAAMYQVKEAGRNGYLHYAAKTGNVPVQM